MKKSFLFVLMAVGVIVGFKADSNGFGLRHCYVHNKFYTTVSAQNMCPMTAHDRFGDLIVGQYEPKIIHPHLPGCLSSHVEDGN